MTYTKLFVTIAMIIIGLYDAVAVTFFGVDGSISRYIQNLGFSSPIFVLMVGFLLGHFWGYMPPEWYKKQPMKTVQPIDPHLLSFLEGLKESGKIYREIDGYYVYDTTGGKGFLYPHVLRQIAQYLDQLNAEFAQQIQKDLLALAKGRS